jgi:hypothetical protein
MGKQKKQAKNKKNKNKIQIKEEQDHHSIPRVSAVAKVQHEPQLPWFFTSVITPLVRQSMLIGAFGSGAKLANSGCS